MYSPFVIANFGGAVRRELDSEAWYGLHRRSHILPCEHRKHHNVTEEYQSTVEMTIRVLASPLRW